MYTLKCHSYYCAAIGNEIFTLKWWRMITVELMLEEN